MSNDLGFREAAISSGRLRQEPVIQESIADGVVTMHDADSGSYEQDGVTRKFRMAGVDAPEVPHGDALRPEPGGYDAMEYARQWFRSHSGAKPVSTGAQDLYGRGDVTEFVAPDGANLGVDSVRTGLVAPYNTGDQRYDDAALGATLRTRTSSGDILTGEDAELNDRVKGVQQEAFRQADAGEYENVALKRLQEGDANINNHGTAANAVDRGIRQTKAMLGGFEAAVGDAFGVDSFKEHGIETAERNLASAALRPAKVSTWDDVNNVTDAGTYALEKTLENLPVIGLTAGAAIATGGTSLVAEGGLAALGANVAASTVARVGAKHGAMAALYAVNTGDSALQLREDGVDDFGKTALAVGVPKTMLDYASLATMSSGVKRAVTNSFKGKGFDPIQSAHDFIKNVTLEGGTEGSQQILDNAASSVKTGREFNFDGVKEAAIAGSVVGGAFGVATAAPGAVKSIITSREPAKDIEAQFQAQRDGAKPATFVSSSNSDAFEAQVEAAGPDATILRSEEGQLATRRPVTDAERQAYESGTPEERGLVNKSHLGYSQDKSEIDPLRAAVVQMTTPDGAVIHEEVTDRPDEVVAKLQESKRPDDVVQVTDAKQAQLRRFESMGRELSVAAAQAHDEVQSLVEQGAPHEQVTDAARKYEQAATHLQDVIQLHEHVSQDTLNTPEQTSGVPNEQASGPANDAGGAVPDAPAQRDGGVVRDGDNAAGPVDSGTPQNSPVTGGRAAGPRVAFDRLGLDERRAILQRAGSDVEFQRKVTQYKGEGHSPKDALEFALADEKISSSDIPNEYSPSADNAMFDEAELPTSDSVLSEDDADAPEKLQNFAKGAYYGELLTAQQEAFTARHPTWELAPRDAGARGFFLEPKPRVFSTLVEAEAEALRLEPLYYGYAFKTNAHDSGGFTLSRHKVNAALSTVSNSPTKSWVHQSLPKIKLQARGAEFAIRRSTKALDDLAKNVSNHTSKFYASRTALLRRHIQDNVDKLVKLRAPDGKVIQVHAPTLTEQGKLLLGQYSTHTTRAQYEFLAFKQALSALAASGYTYEVTQGPTDSLFPPELNISSGSSPLRVREVFDPQTSIVVHEEALRVATDELYRLEGLLKHARNNQSVSGKASFVRSDFISKVDAQRKIVEDLRLQIDNFKSVDPSGKDPYLADKLATDGALVGTDVADGRSETDKFMDNANNAVDNHHRNEGAGFSGSAGEFYQRANVGTPSVTQTAELTFADRSQLDAVRAEISSSALEMRISTPTASQKVTLQRAFAGISRFFPAAADTTVLVEYSGNEGTHFPKSNAVSISARSLALGDQPIGANFDKVQFALAHELSHARDSLEGYPSYFSGLFTDGGAIHDEAIGMLSSADPLVPGLLEYPFNSGLDEYSQAKELFANLSAQFVVNPESLYAKLPTAAKYFEGYYSRDSGKTESPLSVAAAQPVASQTESRGASETRKNLQRPAHLESVRAVPTASELRTKFQGLTPSRVNKWAESLKGASLPFANLVLTGYTQMKGVHAATATRFKTYIAHKNQMGAYWLGVWHNAIGLDTARTAAAFEELRALGESTSVKKSDVSADAWAVRTFLDEIHKSMLKRYSPTFGTIPNYLPQPVDTRAMISDKEGFIATLMQYSVDANKGSTPMDRETAEGIFDSLLGNSGLDGLSLDEAVGAVGVGNKHRYTRVLRNPALVADLDKQGFLFADKREAMEYYITQGVNRSAFERVFGGYRPVVAMLDHDGAINAALLKDKLLQSGLGSLVATGRNPDALLKDAISMGYAKMVDRYVHWYSPVSRLHDARQSIKHDGAALRKFDDLTHGMLGFFGDRVSAETKLWQSRIMAGESLLTLAFSMFSSQTDWAGPALRVMQDKGVAEAWKQLVGGIRSFSNASEANEFAKAFGFIVPRQHQSAIRSMSGADHMSAGSQKTLDALFHYNGQEWFTNMTRSFAASTGVHYFKTLAAAKDDILQSYGIDHEIVARWASAGEHAPTQTMERSDKQQFEDAMAVHAALHKFVNESIMRPDATQRPNWANDPRFALLWHLKSFFWSFWSTLMEPTFKSAFTQAKKGNYGESAAQLAFTGLLLLPLAALGWELKQVIQYSLFGVDQPSDSLTGMEYTFELLARADVFGPAQLAVDTLANEDSGRAVARLAGPAADHLFTLLNAEWDKKLYRSIPILSQLYGAQKQLSDNDF